MTTGFVEYRPEDLIRTSDDAYMQTFDTAAAFEARAQHFNDRASRTHKDDTDLLQKLRYQMAFNIVFRQELLLEQLKHFLPATVDGRENEHYLDPEHPDYIDHVRESFHLTLLLNMARDHMIKACLDMGARHFLTPELLIAVGTRDYRKDSTPDRSRLAHARAQTERLLGLFNHYSIHETFEPDPITVDLTRHEQFGPIILGEAFKPDDFIQISRTIPLNSASSNKGKAESGWDLL